MHLQKYGSLYLIPFGLSACLAGVKVENHTEMHSKALETTGEVLIGTAFPDSAPFLYQTPGWRVPSENAD